MYIYVFNLNKLLIQLVKVNKDQSQKESQRKKIKKNQDIILKYFQVVEQLQ